MTSLNSAYFCRVGLLGLAGAYFVLCIQPAARATEVIPPNFNTMVHRAEVIFRGQVTDIQSSWSGQGTQRTIVSNITFKVLETLKGTATTPYVLQMLGGTVDGQAMEVDGVPKFHIGDETLLFVEHNGTQFFPVVGIMHGYFRVQTDAATGKTLVLKYDGQPLHSTAEIDAAHARAVGIAAAPAGANAAKGGPMQVSDFEAAIRKAESNP